MVKRESVSSWSKLFDRVSAILLSWQLVHLYWLSSHVVGLKLLDRSYFFVDSSLLNIVLALADTTEIPAIILTSIVYFRKLASNERNQKLWLYLILLNSQWLHILWITDEIILADAFARFDTLIPSWLTWLAISIDYLELPVIFNLLKETFFRKRPSQVV